MQTVRRSSELPLGAPVVAELIAKSATFEFVVWPIMKATGDLPERLGPGARADVRLWLFGVIPLNRHVIEVVEADEAAGFARTREHGGVLRQWNHTLRVEPLDEARCRYTDEVEVEAGALTAVAALVARGLFAYRHRRWRQLARVIG